PVTPLSHASAPATPKCTTFRHLGTCGVIPFFRRMVARWQEIAGFGNSHRRFALFRGGSRSLRFFDQAF
ncbi:hypothetical protein, partial [Rubneribacter badeniensis]|uniref:hypothetical protein n=1 Tax=Rubneribacter badeniensis TaxID=2070688 RepID=UPI00195AD605